MSLSAAMLVLVLGAGEPTTYAERSPFGIDPIAHGTFTVITALSVLALQLLVVPNLSSGLACSIPEGQPATYRCPASTLNAFDRLAAGNDSLQWRRASDFGFFITALSSVVALASEAWIRANPSGGETFFADGLVVAESLAITGVLTFVMKIAFRRPRPVHYTPGAYVLDPDAHLSFPSGHTSATTALAASVATAYWLRRPDDPARWAVLFGAIGISSFTGFARIAGGRHFPTDVIAGFLLGATVGIAVPLLVARPNGPLLGRSGS